MPSGFVFDRAVLSVDELFVGALELEERQEHQREGTRKGEQCLEGVKVIEFAGDGQGHAQVG